MNDVVAAWIDQGLPPDLFVIWAVGKANYDQLAHYESTRVRVRAYIAPISEAYRAADFASAALPPRRAASLARVNSMCLQVPRSLVA